MEEEEFSVCLIVRVCELGWGDEGERAREMKLNMWL